MRQLTFKKLLFRWLNITIGQGKALEFNFANKLLNSTDYSNNVFFPINSTIMLSFHHFCGHFVCLYHLKKKKDY